MGEVPMDARLCVRAVDLSDLQGVGRRCSFRSVSVCMRKPLLCFKPKTPLRSLTMFVVDRLVANASINV